MVPDVDDGSRWGCLLYKSHPRTTLRSGPPVLWSTGWRLNLPIVAPRSQLENDRTVIVRSRRCHAGAVSLHRNEVRQTVRHGEWRRGEVALCLDSQNQNGNGCRIVKMVTA